MAMKEAARKTHRSMQGKEIDIDMLRIRNETTLAVGNAKMNARGDELGPNGKIIRKFCSNRQSQRWRFAKLGKIYVRKRRNYDSE